MSVACLGDVIPRWISVTLGKSKRNEIPRKWYIQSVIMNKISNIGKGLSSVFCFYCFGLSPRLSTTIKMLLGSAVKLNRHWSLFWIGWLTPGIYFRPNLKWAPFFPKKSVKITLGNSKDLRWHLQNQVLMMMMMIVILNLIFATNRSIWGRFQPRNQTNRKPLASLNTFTEVGIADGVRENRGRQGKRRPNGRPKIRYKNDHLVNWQHIMSMIWFNVVPFDMMSNTRSSMSNFFSSKLIDQCRLIDMVCHVMWHRTTSYAHIVYDIVCST